MRGDVLALIVGWAVLALSIPLFICFLLTIWLDDIETAVFAFGLPTVFCSLVGYWMLKKFTKPDTEERLRDREAFAAVALSWPVAVAIGAMPFWLGGTFNGPFTADAGFADILRGAVNSWFEAMSGFTTTGATVIDDSMSPNCIAGVTVDCINSQPRGILLWRSLTQWLGGMGIIMLGMLVLARMLGGGMALARAELTGPSLSRLKPRLQQTAVALWLIYIVLTILECILLWTLGGTSLFDAINHSLTTMPSGGFSTHDKSIGYFDSVTVELIIIVFMLLAGVNFSLIWFAWKGQWDKVTGDDEARVYFIFIILGTIGFTIALILQGSSFGPATIDSLFHILSIGTSTGYSTTDYITWPVFTHVILFLLMIIGASAGSTSGGLKILRIRLSIKLAWRELARIAQPRKIEKIRMSGEVVDDDNVALIVGMMLVWTGLFAISCMILSITMWDQDFETIVSVVASSLGNTGPALGSYGPSNTWASMNSWSLIFTSILMWFGRLELLTVLLLFHPRTWRRDRRDGKDKDGLKLLRALIPKFQKRVR